MKKKSLLIVTVLVILIISIGSASFYYITRDSDKTINEDENNNSSKEILFRDVKSLEYGNYSIEDFLENDIKCDEDKCHYLDKDLEYSISEITSLGHQTIEVSIDYNGANYKKDYEVDVSDSSIPEIIFSTDSITLDLNKEFNPEDYIVSVTDNFDGDLNEKVVVENNVDVNTEGKYIVTYSVTDSNGNTNKKEIPVIVKRKDETISTTSNVTGSKGTNTTKIKTTKKKVTTSKKVTTANKTSFKDTVNSIKLNPIKTRYSVLDKKIDKIVKDINSKNKTNYDKLLAAYDYVMNYLSYEIVFVWDQSLRSIMDENNYNYYDARQIYLANEALDVKTGVCDSYAALFNVITRALGFDSYVLNGQVKSTKGGMTGHAWNTIKINGKYYLFDSQIEDSKNGKQRLVYFGKTPKQLNIYKYDLNANIKEFNFYKAIPTLSTNMKMSGVKTSNKSYKLTATSDTIKEDDIEVNTADELTITSELKGVSKYYYKVTEYVYSTGKYTYTDYDNKALNYKVNTSTSGRKKITIHLYEYDNGRKLDIEYDIMVK